MPNTNQATARRSTHRELILLCQDLRDLHAEACAATGARFLAITAEMASLELQRSNLEAALLAGRALMGAGNV